MKRQLLFGKGKYTLFWKICQGTVLGKLRQLSIQELCQIQHRPEIEYRINGRLCQGVFAASGTLACIGNR